MNLNMYSIPYEKVQGLGMNNNPLLESFGVVFDGRMLEIPNARVLTPPKLVYGVSYKLRLQI